MIVFVTVEHSRLLEFLLERFNQKVVSIGFFMRRFFPQLNKKKAALYE